MTILLIDMGNTRTKLGLLHTDTPLLDIAPVAFAHDDMPQVSDWLARIKQPIHAVYGIKVAHDALAARLESLVLPWSLTIQWLDSTTPHSLLSNAYQQPEKLGPDRWFSAIGLTNALGNQPQSFIHASFGTATTIDTVLYDSQAAQYHFAGGLILPGPHLMHQSLATHTAKLGLGEGSLAAFPSDTRSAITSGIAAAQAGAVLRQWLVTAEQQNTAPLLFCSGGGRNYVESELQSATQQCAQRRQSFDISPRWCTAPALDGLAMLARTLHSNSA